jgi:hypothetical protein
MFLSMRSNMANMLLRTPGVSGGCTPSISSGLSSIELICVCLGRFFLGAQHSAWKWPSLPQLKQVLLQGCHHEGASTWAALFCVCLGALAWLLVSIGTGMLHIHGGAFEEFTCHSTYPCVGCWFPWGNRGWLLLWNGWKSGAFCVIELTSCINLTMATIRFFIALYVSGTGGVNTLSSSPLL